MKTKVPVGQVSKPTDQIQIPRVFAELIDDGLYYQKTIKLAEPVSGQRIMIAMKAIPNARGASSKYRDLKYIERSLPGDPPILQVGFTSCMPYEHAVILTGERLDKPELDAQKQYDRIAVGRYAWSSIVKCVGYNSEAVRRSITNIAADLEARLP